MATVYTTAESIGELIFKIRKYYGLPQLKFAVEAGLDSSTISKVETNSRDISLGTLQAIIQRFGVSELAWHIEDGKNIFRARLPEELFITNTWKYKDKYK